MGRGSNHETSTGDNNENKLSLNENDNTEQNKLKHNNDHAET